MDETSKQVILGFLVVCSIGGLIALFVYARQHSTRLEKDATLLKYIGVVIWYGGLVWLCLTHEALEKKIAIPLVVCGVVLHLNGLKFEILRGLRSEQANRSET